MKKEYLTPDSKGYLSPLSIELPMETEECIAMSDPNGYGDGGDMGDDWDEDNE
ncbi:MAG: hypothetical protein IKR30_07510 [Bacteroidales bacterium]|nr:hypothetical protein [Bacteroidales bacterium]